MNGGPGSLAGSLTSWSRSRSSKSTREGARFSFAASSPTARDAERGYYEMRLFRQGMLRMQRFTYDESTRQPA